MTFDLDLDFVLISFVLEMFLDVLLRLYICKDFRIVKNLWVQLFINFRSIQITDSLSINLILEECPHLFLLLSLYEFLLLSFNLILESLKSFNFSPFIVNTKFWKKVLSAVREVSFESRRHHRFLMKSELFYLFMREGVTFVSTAYYFFRILTIVQRLNRW